MSKTNVEQSVRQKLLNIANAKGLDYNIVLIWYGLERFLYRLSKSDYRNHFILKGAMLFSVWAKQPLRPTKDLDLMAYGNASENCLREIFVDVCHTKVEDDGLVFDEASIGIHPIREDQEYAGQRIKLLAKMGNAKIKLQIDIGFGDAITPEPSVINYPTLLGSQPISLKAYPKETVVAEKLNAMVVLGIANSRMKDFFDIWMMSRQLDFDGPTLSKAIMATFERRQTRIPDELPLAFSEDFIENAAIRQRWTHFISKFKLSEDIPQLKQIINDLKGFLLMPLQKASIGDMPNQKWINNQWQ